MLWNETEVQCDPVQPAHSIYILSVIIFNKTSPRPSPNPNVINKLDELIGP